MLAHLSNQYLWALFSIMSLLPATVPGEEEILKD